MKKKLGISCRTRKNRGLFMIAVIMLSFSAFTLQASDSSGKEITIMKKNARLIEVFTEIERQTEYKFFYNNSQIDTERKVSIHVEKENLKKVLDELFRNSSVTYNFLENYIVLTINKNNLLRQSDNSTPGKADIPGEPGISSPENLNVAETLKSYVRQITGQVHDELGQTMPGVSVLIKETNVGTTTDASGKYSLDVPESSNVLVFSFVGYLSQDVLIDGRSVIDVSMQPDIKTLNEVIVIGYGEQKKITVTGAVATAKGEDLKIAPVASVSNTLVGRLPGLIAKNQSGEPGNDDSNLLIRGLNTFGDNSPLVVVDGVADRAGGFNRIDPNDIESLTILKDASAAIYGARAANGVILVTTKRGKDGKTNISYSVNYGLKTPTVVPNMVDAADYARALNEVQTLIYGQSPMYTDQEIQKFRDGSDPVNYPNVNQFKEAFKKYSPIVKHNVNISGGGEKVRYFTSLGTIFEDNYYKNSASNYTQYNFRSNIDVDATKDLKFYANVSLRQQDRNSPSGDQFAQDAIFRNIVQGDPRINVEWPGGLLNAMTEEGYNPKALTNGLNGYHRDRWTYINADAGFRWNLPRIKGLGLEGGLFLDKGNNFNKLFNKTYTLYSRNNSTGEYEPRQFGPRNAQLGEVMRQNVGITQRIKLNYSRTFGDVHNLNSFIAYEQNETKYDQLEAGRTTFVSSTLDQLFVGPASSATNNGTASATARRNYFGRVDYSFSEKYLLQFNWRYDGSQNFPKSNRYGFFPGVSAGWRVSEEGFWQNSLSAINYFKIRGSWGKMGNDRIRYNGRDQYYTYLTNYTFDWHAVFGGINPISYTGIAQVQTGNPNVTWEVGTTYNLGFESRFLDNAVSFEFDIFKQRRENILDQPTSVVPLYAGLSLPAQNFAKCESSGLEAVLGYTKTLRKVRLNVSGNISYAKSKIVSFNEPDNTPAWQKRTGKPIGSDWLLYESIGIFRTPADTAAYPRLGNATVGDLIYRDVNNDGMIDDNDRIRPAKSTTPRIIYGLNISASYRNFELTMLWQGAGQFWQYVFYEAGAGYGTYTQDYFDNRWTPENPNASGPRIYDREVTTLGRPNTYLLRNSSYMRLKNIQLSYSIPVSSISKLPIKDLRLFVSGFNLITLTGIKDVDPEAPTSNQGYSGWYNIQQKTYNAGLNVTF